MLFFFSLSILGLCMNWYVFFGGIYSPVCFRFFVAKGTHADVVVVVKSASCGAGCPPSTTERPPSTTERPPKDSPRTLDMPRPQSPAIRGRGGLTSSQTLNVDIGDSFVLPRCRKAMQAKRGLRVYSHHLELYRRVHRRHLLRALQERLVAACVAAEALLSPHQNR